MRQQVRVAAQRERPPRARPQDVPHPVRDLVRQLRQVVRREAAAGGGEQAEEFVREAAARQEVLELPFRLRPDRAGLRGGGQEPDDRRVPERVVPGDVRREGRVEAAGDDDREVGRAVREERGDRVGVGARRHAPVLVQAVHEQDQALAARRAGLGGGGVQAQQVGLAGGGGQQGRQALARQLRELLQDHVRVRGHVVLRAEPGGDEEGDDPHALGRGEREPRHQRRLARPRVRPPPPVAGPRAAELRQFRQLLLAADELRRGDPADLLPVRRADRRGRAGHDAVAVADDDDARLVVDVDPPLHGPHAARAPRASRT
ncbi:hypothetical protein [Streptomyces cinereoruber]|uniref:hypothetical protein n=1 Tax=Streptomyces cinereoruber TaxID=67260 RepID=UPI0036295712